MSLEKIAANKIDKAMAGFIEEKLENFIIASQNKSLYVINLCYKWWTSSDLDD